MNASLALMFLFAAVSPGATFTGPFTLPARRGPGWITIRSSRLRALQRGRRVRRRDARHMPRLLTPGRGLPVLMTATWFDSETAAEPRTRLPRCHAGRARARLLHGTTAGGLQRCVSLNSAATTIRDSRLTDCHDRGDDTQVIGG